MQQRSSVTNPETARGRRAWSFDALCQKLIQPSSQTASPASFARAPLRRRPASVGVTCAVAATASHAAATTAAASPAAWTSHHLHRGARTPAQLAEELSQYAAVAAAAGARPGHDIFLATYLAELSVPHRLRRLRPRQLATLLRSLVHLGAHPGEDWLAELDACCYCHPGPFDPASATAVLQSLAALHTTASTTTTAASTVAATAPTIPATTSSSISSTTSSTSGTGGATATASKTSRSHKAQHPRGGSSHRRGGATAGSRSSGRAGGWSYSSLAATAVFEEPSECLAPWEAAGDNPAPCFRFPQAVYLRLVQGGLHNYSYEQLATLLQSFRCLGVPVSDDVAVLVGSRMASLLLEMVPEQRQRALAGVLGASASGGAGGGAGPVGGP